MKPRRRTSWPSCLAAVITLAAPYHLKAAEGFNETYQKLAATQKHDSLTLEITLPKQSFFMGELIPVTFRFADTKNTGKFRVSTRDYDRSGRIHDIRFVLDGQLGASVDPLGLRFSGGYSGGGLGGEHDLGEYEQVFYMNEWVRMDRPGRYRFYATANQLSTKDKDIRHPGELVSQIQEIEITTPTSEQLEKAFNEADAGFGPHDWAMNRSEATNLALHRLRHLDTKESRYRLFQIMQDGRGGEFEAMLGLTGTREVDATIELLDFGISDPDVAVSSTYLSTLAILRRTHEYRKKVAATPAGTHIMIEGLIANRDDRQKLLDTFDDKQGRARAVSALTLIRFIWNDRYQDNWAAEQRANGEKATILDKHLRLDHDNVIAKRRLPLAKEFTELEPYDQQWLLKEAWDLIRNPEYAEPLLKLVKIPETDAERSVYSYVGEWAKLRLLELDPDAEIPTESNQSPNSGTIRIHSPTQ